mmetsp:Transcript_29452/g.65228  ORF Transcript_29452/g.65228 Transcript_29452/m.65228 type:complete len:222 (+) Transcript_29452:145-810(+)
MLANSSANTLRKLGVSKVHAYNMIQRARGANEGINSIVGDLHDRLRNLELDKKGPLSTVSYEEYFELANPRLAPKEDPAFWSLPSIPEERRGERIHGLPVASDDESEVMLPKFLNCLRATFEEGNYDIQDTHSTRFLDGKSPDITLIKKGSVLSPLNVVLTIELQKGEIDNKHRGKAAHYNMAVLKDNPFRAHSYCFTQMCWKCTQLCAKGTRLFMSSDPP